MQNPTPRLGDTVRYTLTEYDADAITVRRQRVEVAQKHNSKITRFHMGESVHPGEVYPMIITRVWSPVLVNGQLILDGDDSYWVTSVSPGSGPGYFTYPSNDDPDAVR